MQLVSFPMNERTYLRLQMLADAHGLSVADLLSKIMPMAINSIKTPSKKEHKHD